MSSSSGSEKGGEQRNGVRAANRSGGGRQGGDEIATKSFMVCILLKYKFIHFISL